MAKKININGNELMIETFVPHDQTRRGKESIEEQANRMCDEFLKKHPELEEVLREETSGCCEKIESCFSTIMSMTYVICVYKVK